MHPPRERGGPGKPADDLAPASALPLHVPRRGLLVVVALVGMAIATLTSVAIARRSALEWKRAEEELNRTLDEQHSAVDDREFELAQTERIVEATLREHGSLQKPLGPTAVGVLTNARNVFGRYVEQNHADPRTVLTRARALRNLGEIDQWLGLVAESEAGYRESRRLLQRQCDESPDHIPRLLLAATNNSLGCLLATTGRAAEAERPASEAVAELESLLAEDPHNSPARSELCEASRNLGLILALLGRDGTTDVRRSIAQTRLLAAEAPAEITIAEFLVDTHQILAQLLWRQGRFSEAESACGQSIQEIEGLLKRFQAFADRDGRLLPTLPYRQATAMARSNLARVQGGPEGNRPPADSWQWRPLYRWPGRVVQADVLLHGSLHGEFERQDALLMAWLDEPWCDETLVKVVAETCRNAQIIILVDDELSEQEAKEALRAAGVAPDGVRLCHVPTDTAWIRDYGPMVVDTGGGTCQCVAPRRAPNPLNLLPADAHASLALSRALEMPVVPAPVFLDGADVLSNGEGLCLVSADLLDGNCRAGYPESHVTSTIKRLFGAKQVVYLEPLDGEPAGHVDWFATFTSPDTIVLGDYRGTDPVNTRLLDQHAERLAGVTTANGPLKVERIPMPPRGERYFGGTYTNVVFANGVLLVPTYPESPPELEREALDLFRRLLPDWRVVGIECPKHVTRYGALHCAVVNLYRVCSPSRSGLAAGERGAGPNLSPAPDNWQ
jgi:agmatine/peptidylarginine deiminase/tetratricopeptide (TPR) repeat protein